MNASIRFVMHADDEAVLVRELLRDPSVCFVDGPRWPAALPATTRDLAQVGSYCIVWSTADLPVLASEYMPKCNDWYCRSEPATIQFLRSRGDPNSLSEGRLAIATGAGIAHCGGRCTTAVHGAAAQHQEDVSQRGRLLVQPAPSERSGYAAAFGQSEPARHVVVARPGGVGMARRRPGAKGEAPCRARDRGISDWGRAPLGPGVLNAGLCALGPNDSLREPAAPMCRPGVAMLTRHRVVATTGGRHV